VDITKTCELEIYDLHTDKIAFCIQLYGISATEMRCVPPALDPSKLFERLRIPQDRYTTGLFLVREARRYVRKP
jgi:hypothetical protein